MNKNVHPDGVQRENQSSPSDRKRIKDLLDRYPNTDRHENEEIIYFLKRGSILENGLLKSDESVRTKIVAFELDHKKAFRASPTQMSVLLAIILGVIIACIMMWDAGR